jgi:hypothetical protein
MSASSLASTRLSWSRSMPNSSFLTAPASSFSNSTWAQTRDLLGAIHNAPCYVLEDGSPHADRFAKNLQNLMQWCERKGITFVQWDTTGKPVV